MKHGEEIVKQIGVATQRGFLRKIGAKVETCHWGWLAAGIAVGWPIDWVCMLIQNSLHFIVPIIAPLIVDGILGPINEAIVAIVPLICAREFLRRMGLGDDKKNGKEDEQK